MKELTDCHNVHHGCDLGYTPSHYKRPNRKVLLKCSTKDNESANVQRHSYVACPVEYPCPQSSYFDQIANDTIGVLTIIDFQPRKHRCYVLW